MIGFGAESGKKNIKFNLQSKGIDKLLRDYKKIKKYMKSPLFAVKTIDGNEEIVSSLLKEAEDNPM